MALKAARSAAENFKGHWRGAERRAKILKHLNAALRAAQNFKGVSAARKHTNALSRVRPCGGGAAARGACTPLSRRTVHGEDLLRLAVPSVDVGARAAAALALALVIDKRAPPPRPL